MKTCPYCREDVHDDAIKCRHCHSMLLAIDLPKKEDNGGHITYVLDRDLIRFAKFSGAVLAVFLVVGAYLFGIKLDLVSEKVRDTQQELKVAQDKMAIAQKDLEAAQLTVKRLNHEVEAVLAEAKSQVGEISHKKSEAFELVALIKVLTPQQTTSLQEAKKKEPEKFRRGVYEKFWKAGSTIRIRFLEGDEATHQKVKEIAEEWAKYANLKFEFGTSGFSEIRISFQNTEENNWGYSGTDALVIPSDQPTMNLAKTDRRSVLKTFGTAIGLLNEHQNPNANIAWNKELIYREMMKPPKAWEKSQIDHNIFRKVSKEALSGYRDFDPHSIMMGVFEKEWVGGVSMGPGENLTESDKALVAQIYPPTK